MTSREEFDVWWGGNSISINNEYEKDTAFEAWQARGEVDAKRIAELEEDKLDLRTQTNYRCADVQRLEAKLAIAIDAFEAIKECSGTSQRQWHLAKEALIKIKGEE